jgi:hypothetical protein
MSSQIDDLLPLGLSMPNHVGATMYPSPQVIGVIAVVYGKVQLMTGAVSTGLVAWPYDGRSPLSMASAAGSLKVFRVEEVRSHPHCPVMGKPD